MSQIDDFLNDKPAAKPAASSDIDAFLSDSPKGYGLKDFGGDVASVVTKGVMAVPQAAVGLADIATGGRAGKALEDIGVRFNDANQIADSWKSDALKAQQQDFQQAEGLAGKTAAALRSPGLLLSTVGESVPSMFAGGALAKGVGMAVPALAGRAGLAAAGEGAIMAGQQAENIRQQTNDGLLTAKQSALAAGTGLAGGAIGALGAKAAKSLGIGDIDTMIANGSTQSAARDGLGLVNRVGRGALSEGVLEELPQSLTETALGNIAMDRDVTQGMDEAAVLGTLSGGLMGGAAGAMSRAPAPLVQAAGLQTIDPIDAPDAGIAPIKPSEAMGLDPAAGPLSRAAATAVDQGTVPQVQAAAVQDSQAAQTLSPEGQTLSPVPDAQVEPLGTAELQQSRDIVPSADFTAQQPDLVTLESRSIDELRQSLRNAQDPAIRRTVAAEIRRRREAMPDPLQQQGTTLEPKTTEPVQTGQEESQAPAGQPSTEPVTISQSAEEQPNVSRTPDVLRNGSNGSSGAGPNLSDAGMANDVGVPYGASGTVAPVIPEPVQSSIGQQPASGQTALRPERWRQNALQAGKVARGLGLDPKGKRLAQIVAEIDAKDGGAEPAASGYEAAKKVRDAASDRMDAASAVINKFPRGAMGLTPDDVRATPEWKAAKNESDTAFKQLQDANSVIAKNFAKESRADRDAQRVAKANVQNPQSRPAGAEAQAAPVEASTADRGDAAAAGAVSAKAGAGDVQADGVKETWGLTREQYFNDPARVRREAVGPAVGGWKASYEYTEPSGAGPFKGSTVIKVKPKAGDTINAPFGRARITTVSAVKGAAIDNAELFGIGKAHHKRVVADALASGKPVPADVLAEYPDLSKNQPKADTSAEPVQETEKTEQVAKAPAEPVKPEPAPQPERFEAGKSLTKEQRREVLKSLVDVYKQKGADRELKGVDQNGNERYGYVYSPDLFEKSDITGSMVRYFVTMPDGRKAHPTELFPDLSASDVERIASEQEAESKRSAAYENALKPFYEDYDDAALRAGKSQLVIAKDGRFAIIPSSTGAVSQARSNGWEIAKPVQPKTENPADAQLDASTSEATETTYDEASQAHQKAATAFAERLSKNRESFVLMDAVKPTGARAKEAQSVYDLAKTMFGREVVFVKFKGRPLFNGAVSTTDPGKIFVNIESARPMMAVLGHELLHELRKSNPAAYNQLAKTLKSVTKDDYIYEALLKQKYRDQGLNWTPQDISEELYGDIVGDNFMDPKFWEALAGDKPILAKQLYRAVMNWLDKIAAMFKRVKVRQDGSMVLTLAEQADGSRPFGTQKYLQDIEAARAAVAQAMGQFKQGGKGRDALSVAGRGKNAVMPENKAPGPQGDAQQGANKGNAVTKKYATDDYVPAPRDRVSAKRIKQINARGLRHAKTGDWESYYTPVFHIAYQLGQNGVDLADAEVVEGLRYGKAPEFGVSKNYADDITENGLSLAQLSGSSEIASSMWFKDRKAFEYRGLLIGEGSDGEAVILPINVENLDDSPNDQPAPVSGGASDALSIADAVEQIKQFDVKTAPKNTWAHYRGMAMQALGRRQIVDLYAEELPQLEHYNDLVQRMDAEKNESGAEADNLAQEWGKLKNGEDRALAELMHDATLAQMDPSKAQEPGTLTIQYKALESRYKALTPEARALFGKARDMYKAHYTAVQKAIKERIERSEMSDGQKRQIMARMDEELFKELKGVYFPLARFGQYVIVVKDANGEVKNVTRSETVKEAEAARKELQKAFPAHMGNTVGKVLKQAEFNAGRDAVGKGFMADLMGALDNKGVDDELRDTVAQLYLSSLPDLSWAKHGIHRKGTPGFSQDARRAFAQNMFHGARYLAKLRYADQLQDQLTAMQDHIKAYEGVEEYDSVEAQQVVDEMVKRHEFMMNPKSSPVSTALTSFGFLFHMGLSPASAAVNLTQTALVAFPQMGAKWGFGKASSALIKASEEVVRAKNDLSKVLKGDELEALNQAINDGTIDVTMAHDLAGISQGEDQGVMWKVRPVMRAASFMFHHAEKFNRQATFIAAFRLAKSTPDGATKPFRVLYEEAQKATYDGHFDYSAGNRPRLMQGNWQKVIFLFKQYATNMLYTLSRNAYQSIKALDPKERAQARKTLAGLLTAHAAAAGVLGLPIVGQLLTIASWIGGDDDEPWDAEVAMQNAMAEMLGPKAAEVMARGLSRLTPFDLSGRVALNKLILPDVQEGLEGKEWAESAMAAALGPVAGIGVNVARGMQKITEGDYMRGIEDMLPTALRGPIKAMRYAQEGAVDKTGIVITDEVSAAGVIGQASGFSPSQVRRDTERRSAIYGYDRALLERRSVLMRMFAEARIQGDNETAQEVQADIQKFNEKHPNRRITGMSLAQSIRNRRKRVAEAEQGVYLPSKRRDAIDAVNF